MQLALALRRSRGFVIPDGFAGLRQAPVSTLAGRAAGHAELRWDADIRVGLLHGELMSRLTFVEPLGWCHLNEGIPDGHGNLAGLAVPVIGMTPPGDAVWPAQVERVLALAEQREDRMPEIVEQAGGLWPFWSAITYVDSANAPRTAELVAAAEAFATTMVMRLKHQVAAPRPTEISSAVHPDIATPGHGSLPSGHATMAYMGAEMLALLLGDIQVAGQPAAGTALAPALRRLAYRVAENRVVAGVHYPVDSLAGRLLGETLAAYVAWRCTGAPQPVERALFDGATIGSAGGPALPVSPGADPLYLLGAQHACTPGQMPAAAAYSATPLLERAWAAAVEELKALGLRA